MRNVSIVGLVVAVGLACTPDSGTMSVEFRFDADRPPADQALSVLVWVESSAGGPPLVSFGPARFRDGVESNFFGVPNDTQLVLHAEIADAPWRNARVLLHASSEPFVIRAGEHQRVVAVFRGGPRPDAGPGAIVDVPNVDRVKFSRWPVGSEATGGDERYAVEGTEGATFADATIVVYGKTNVAAAVELGRASADAAGAFTVLLDPAEARGLERVFIASADSTDRLSDASSEDGLQASPVVAMSTTLIAATNGRGLDVGSVALAQASRDQLNVAWSTADAVANVRRTDTNRLVVAPEPVWRTYSDVQPPPRYNRAAAYHAGRGSIVTFGGVRNSTPLASDETWEWNRGRWSSRTRAGQDPPRLQRAFFTYDGRRDRIVMFGGIDISREGTNAHWEWDGAQWEERLFEAQPTPRTSHALAYDAARGVVLLYGGGTGERFEDDFWSFDGDDWRPIERTPMWPPTLAGHSMVYDSRRQRLVLFGGATNAGRGDAAVWEWDGRTWSRHAPAMAPTPRFDAGMAYDERRGRVVLFGGRDGSVLPDRGLVWEWDGTNWVQFDVDGPAMHSRANLVYDPTIARTVLLGGYDERLSDAGHETWLWDGERWTDATVLSGSRPEVRRGAAIAASLPDASAMIFGGSDDRGGRSDLWTLDRGWSQNSIEAENPPPVARLEPSLVFDAAQRRAIAYGGGSTTDAGETTIHRDTWSWDGERWQQLDLEGPPVRIYQAMAWDAANQRPLLFGGVGQRTFLGDLWAFEGERWSAITSTGAMPSARRTSIAYDSGRNRLVLFGGEGSNGRLEDTWEWDGTTWHVRTPTTTASPPPLVGHALAYDPVRGRTVLFGGGDAQQFIGGDRTWEWDGVRWYDVTPSTSPSRRLFHKLVYDSVRGAVVMFGGLSDERGLVEVNDLWTWDGTAWTKIEPNGDWPTPRSDHGFAYDPFRNELLVFGGFSGVGGMTNDLWTYDGNRWTERTPTVVRPEPRERGALGFDVSGDQTILFGGAAEDGALLEGSWAYRGRSWRALGSAPPARWGHTVSADPNAALLLFGGRDRSVTRADVWLFADGTWERWFGAGPSSRWRHSATTVSSTIGVLLFGGASSAGHLDDTWLWDGAGWARRDGTTPPPREGHAVATDPRQSRVIMFGGLNSNGPRNDLWEWSNRNGWIQRTPPSPIPEARHDHALIYDRRLERMVLFGGTPDVRGGDVVDDSWELFADPRQSAGTLIVAPLAAAGVQPANIVGASMSVVHESSSPVELSYWDAWSGAWRSTERDDSFDIETSSSAVRRTVSADGTMSWFARGRSAIAVDYVEVRIEHR